MAKCLVGAVGGLPAADKAKLLPENIRKGVTIAKVTGTLEPADELDVLASMYYYKGTIKRVMIFQSSGGNICGHSGPGTYTSGHTNTISGFDNKAQSFVVLGRK